MCVHWERCFAFCFVFSVAIFLLCLSRCVSDCLSVFGPLCLILIAASVDLKPVLESVDSRLFDDLALGDEDNEDDAKGGKKKNRKGKNAGGKQSM